MKSENFRFYKLRESFIIQCLERKALSNLEISDLYKEFLNQQENAIRKIAFSDFYNEYYFANERILKSAKKLSKQKKIIERKEIKAYSYFFEIKQFDFSMKESLASIRRA